MQDTLGNNETPGNLWPYHPILGRFHLGIKKRWSKWWGDGERKIDF